MSEKTRSIFVRLDKAEVSQIKALSREFSVPMEEVVRRMVLHALSELEAETKPVEAMSAEERQRHAFEAARREVEGWRPEF